MKLVRFTRDMRPHHAGDTRVVPDQVADYLIAQGDAVACESAFDQQPRPEATLVGPKRYITRKRR